MIERLEGVRARSRLERVALSEDSDVATPLVLGQQEICIPLLTLGELSDAELDTVLAHEIAHLERGDGFWFPAVGLVEAVLWFNPLNHWAARRFRESAELACDDRAVVLTGDPLGLARALVQVAEGSPRARRLALAPTMFRSASALVPRVRRLTGVRFMPDSGVLARGRRFALGSFGVLGAVVATLSVQVVDARPEAARAPARVMAVDTVPPDPAEASERIAETLNRERELEHELAAAVAMPGAQDDRTPAGVRLLELSQALRHARETTLWLERSFVEREASFEAQRAAATVR
jgi:hypothetical protein